ncbi:CBS domain-containing protein [Streptomyces violaceus]|uniref:CBS domain-containing protein n=1 Tax=Streptomyces violaceus TaxID=1936 RepID=UPI002E2BABB7|nr:CBS domain-containing protein [Streptomyces violaceus]
MRTWVVRAGRDGQWEREALDEGVALAGWREVPDLSGATTREAVRVAVEEAYPDEGPYTQGNWTGQLHRFRNEIEDGDLVVLPLRSGVVAVGEVHGTYEYGPDRDGAPHVRHVEWRVRDAARERFRPDLLDSMGSLLTVFELSRFGAAERIAGIAAGGTDPGRPDADEFAATLTEPARLFEEVRRRGTDQPLTLSVRDLLGVWNAQRRNATVVEEISNDLALRGLVTVPPFTEGSLDSTVAVLPVGTEPGEERTSDLTRSGFRGVVAESQDVAYLVSNLEAANRKPESVRVGDSLHSAMTLMVLRGYSQLPVLDDDDRLRGVVSWESIGRARMSAADVSLAAATVRAREADRSDDLLDWIPEIQRTGYLLIRDHDHRVCGLITSTDLTEQFGTRVRPFVLLEEIEQRLRRAVDAALPLDRIRAVVSPRRASRVHSAADLNLGAYGHLLKVPENWSALGWSIDRQLFFDALEECRKFRNNVMHFSPDPITEDQLRPAQGLLDLMRSLDPHV